MEHETQLRAGKEGAGAVRLVEQGCKGPVLRAGGLVQEAHSERAGSLGRPQVELVALGGYSDIGIITKK